jgi:SAM-dependent methyltransferase
MDAPGNFYRQLAGRYDEMTRFRERLGPEQKVLEAWARQYRWQSVLDAACGSGLYSIVCARLGLAVTGTDLEPAMIALAKQHAVEFAVSARFETVAMQELPAHFDRTFDAVLCLGNSFPHLLTDQDCDRTLAGFFQLLNPGGTVVIQSINYDRVLAKQERVVAINRSGDREFVRFYDFIPPLVRFNVLTIDWADGKATPALESTELYPYRADEMRAALSRAGFSDITLYGDLRFAPFMPTESKDLVIVGKAR